MKLLSAPSTLSASELKVSGLDTPQLPSKLAFNGVSENSAPVALCEPAECAEMINSHQISQAAKPKPRKELPIFWSTFLTIFLAEIGDKTQVTTLLMSAESQSPWLVFAGAGTALVATSIIGVLLGQWLAKRLSPKTLETGAGVSMLVISGLLLWDVMH